MMDQMQRRDYDAKYYHYLSKQLEQLRVMYDLLHTACEREGWKPNTYDWEPPWEFIKELQRRQMVIQFGESPDWWEAAREY